MGIILSFEGVDQSGKKTQSKLLVNRLTNEGFKVSYLSFPRYSTLIGKELKRSLSGKRSYPKQVFHLLMAANRWEVKKLIDEKKSKTDILIINRYIHSNTAYGVANGLSNVWLTNLDKGLPFPEKIILLDIPIKVSFVRKSENRDINEKNLEYLLKVRKIYLSMAKEYRWKIINGNKSQKEIQKQIFRYVHKIIKNI